MKTFPRASRLLLLLAAGTILRAAADPVPAPASPPAAADPAEGQALLKKIGAYYQGLSSFQTDITVTTHVEMPTMKNDLISTFTAAMARPNRFALAMQTGMIGGTLVSDGKTVLTYMGVLGQYTRQDAPATLDSLVDPMTQPMLSGGLPLGVESLIRSDPAAALAEGSGGGVRFVGRETLNGAAAQRFHAEGESMATDYWFADGAAPLLLQTETHMDLAATFKKLPKERRNQLPAGFDQMKTWRTVAYANWKVNQPVPGSAFAFQPPASAKQVDGFGSNTPEKSHPLAGQTAPDFTLRDLDGKEVALSSLRGKVVVLDFWATWCPPCVKALPLVTQVTAGFRDRGVVFYAVNQRETAEQVRAFQKEKALAFPVLLDSEGKAGGLYQANAIPQSVLIDKEGKIAAVHVGYRPDLPKTLAAQLEALAADRPLDAPAPAASSPAPSP